MAPLNPVLLCCLRWLRCCNRRVVACGGLWRGVFAPPILKRGNHGKGFMPMCHQDIHDCRLKSGMPYLLERGKTKKSRKEQQLQRARRTPRATPHTAAIATPHKAALSRRTQPRAPRVDSPCERALVFTVKTTSDRRPTYRRLAAVSCGGSMVTRPLFHFFRTD
jgi:hypothetical protein